MTVCTCLTDTAVSLCYAYDDLTAYADRTEHGSEWSLSLPLSNRPTLSQSNLLNQL